jgi:DNA invertase Pin-like site-specific DNA recombinase
MDRERRRPGAGEQQESQTAFRCAIYTRKSTEEGLGQEFNTLEAQRESAEAYVQSQIHTGWTALAEHYDDGGFTGANLERPALRKLLVDIEAGRIDCVLVYKVDRLSRSLLDFARLMEIFERRKVSLVSVTQPLNTTSSLGRLTLNILLSFAEFERTMIADRTRDKMGAARRKGKWLGGMPVLGYDIAEAGGRLVVNPEEADRVRSIFALYLQHPSVASALAEMQTRKWTTKRWRTRDGKEHEGRPFTKVVLHRLLKNILYIGKIFHQDVVYAGEQAPIIDDAVWNLVREKLAHERTAASAAAATKASGIALRRSTAVAAVRVEQVPRITRLLALALKFEDLIRSGTVTNYASVAQVARVSRSRVTQMTGLLNLAPDIQEEILFLPAAEARELRISEPSLRRLTATLLWNQQREQWRSMRRSDR